MIVNLKRTFIVAAALAMMVGMPAIQEVLAKPPQGKTRICHFTRRGAGKGIVIEVSNKAVAPHIRLHGDCRDFEKSSHQGRQCRCNSGSRDDHHGQNVGDHGED